MDSKKQLNIPMLKNYISVCVILYKWAQQTSLCSHLSSHSTSFSPNMCSPFHLLLCNQLAATQRNRGVCCSPKHLTDNIRFAIPGNPRVCSMSLCPELVKKGQSKANQYQLPSCDLARNEIKKISPIHNLYNLTLGRKQHLGCAPSRTASLDGWVLPTLSV